MLSQLHKDLGEVRNMVPCPLRLDNDVVDIRLDDASYQLPKDTSHASLESSTWVPKPERSEERGCELVRYAHRYLVVPGVRIKKIEGFTPSCRNNYLIYARKRKQILGTCLVKARAVNTDPPFLILLLYKYQVSKTLGVKYFSDVPCIKELHDFLANLFALLVVEAAKTLLYRFRSRLDVQYVLGNLSRDPLHIGGFPCEHVEVRFEEVDERTFLFRIERRPDMKRTAIIRDGRILDVLGGLERAGRSLGRLGDILVLGRKLGVELLGPDECLSKLKAFSVTLECTLIRGPYCDDPFKPGIFSFRYV
jgi:hypothetical protein